MFDGSMFAGEYDRRSAWLWLIANAAWKDHHARISNGVVALARGEVVVARDHLASVWGWTPSRVRTFLDQLCAVERISFRQSNGRMPNVAKISKYEHFQNVGSGRSPDEPPVDRQLIAGSSPVDRHTVQGNNIQGTRVEAAPKSSGKVNGVALETALADFNTAADRIGFSRCTTLTDQRAKALGKRLAELGQEDLDRGVTLFREALSAIPHDAFLAGKAKPRAGEKPFRLNLERLLSTDSKMGDVLAKLLDLHAEHGPANVTETRSAPKRDAVADMWSEAQAEELATQRARVNGQDAGGAHVDFC